MDVVRYAVETTFFESVDSQVFVPYATALIRCKSAKLGDEITEHKRWSRRNRSQAANQGAAAEALAAAATELSGVVLVVRHP